MAQIEQIEQIVNDTDVLVLDAFILRYAGATVAVAWDNLKKLVTPGPIRIVCRNTAPMA